MKELLKLSQKRRSIIFDSVAKDMNVNPIIIEKDFWVCLILDYLMNKSKYKDCLIFKGGTSLSKCYDIISRFSEDVDLILKWDVFGYTDDFVFNQRSKNQYNLFEKALNKQAAFFIQNNIKNDLLENLLTKVNGLNIISDEKDPMVLYVQYPHDRSNQYINPMVKLEIGPVSPKTPTERKTISPYYAKYFDLGEDDNDIEVEVISIARTFWDKILIIYAETNRPIEKKMPARYFRHYHDVAMIYSSGYYQEIIKQKSLFEEVKDFKPKYYRNSWSNIESCDLSVINLSPSKQRKEELKKDYNHMKEMFFNNVPSFDKIIQTIKMIEIELRNI